MKDQPQFAKGLKIWMDAGGEKDEEADFLGFQDQNCKVGFFKYPGLVEQNTFEQGKINFDSDWHPGY